MHEIIENVVIYKYFFNPYHQVDIAMKKNYKLFLPLFVILTFIIAGKSSAAIETYHHSITTSSIIFLIAFGSILGVGLKFIKDNIDY